MLCDRHDPYIGEIINAAWSFAVMFAFFWSAFYLINKVSVWQLKCFRRIALAEVLAFIFYYLPNLVSEMPRKYGALPALAHLNPLPFLGTLFFATILLSLINVLLLPLAYWGSGAFEDSKLGRVASPSIIFVLGVVGTYIDLNGMTQTC